MAAGSGDTLGQRSIAAASRLPLFTRGLGFGEKRLWNGSRDQDWWHEPSQARFEAAPSYSPVPTTEEAAYKDYAYSGHKGLEMKDVQLRPFEDASKHAASREEEEELDTDSDAFKRAEIRASVFDTYAICSALFAGFSCSQPNFTATTFEQVEKQGGVRIFAMHLQQWTLYLCTAGGVYATIIFTFCALYSKTALAQPKNGLQLLEQFLSATASSRLMAFYSMYFTTLGFSTSLVMNIFQQFRLYRACVAVIPIILVLGFTVLHSRRLIAAAAPIFAPAGGVPVKSEDSEEDDEVEEGDMGSADDGGGSLRPSGPSSSRDLR